MKEILNFLTEMPTWYSAILVPFLVILFFFVKYDSFRSLLFKFVPNSNTKIIKVLDLILLDGFDSINRINQIQFIDLKSRKNRAIDEQNLSLYMKLCRIFDDEIEKSKGEQDPTVEKKLFESVATVLLNIASIRICGFFDEKSNRSLGDSYFRLWAEGKYENLKNDLERELYNRYPEKNLIVTRVRLENIIAENKSDIKDSFFNLAFKIKDLEKEISSRISGEKESFKINKEKIFKDFLAR